MRRCLVTRVRLKRETMLRFVAAPETVSPESLVFDAAATLPGRGLWLSARRDVIERAVKTNAFSRAAGRRLVAPSGLAELVASTLEQRIAERLGLARRAGQAVCGFEKAKERIASGQCALLVEASDGSLAEQERLVQRRETRVVRPLNAARLGAVFGRERSVHVAIGPGRLAVQIEADSVRLAGVTDTEPASLRLQAPQGAGREKDDRGERQI
ncbi:MAG TPA: DUF448 domain-containing protein [Acidiphilium sp.]|nr:DUF448 domain-containing protein [Acidiphilium sp.]